MSNHPKWKNRWNFTKHCKTNQIAYRSFIGDPEADHDLYALAKTKRKKKLRERWERAWELLHGQKRDRTKKATIELVELDEKQIQAARIRSLRRHRRNRA